jgi:pimeloyl-ACP methyl ester carboxylesterase
MPALLGYMAERNAHRERWVGALVDSPVPIKLLNGESDPVSGAHLADRWDELLPHRASERLTSVGHWPQLEAPEAVIRSALAFFAAPDAAERDNPP